MKHPVCDVALPIHQIHHIEQWYFNSLINIYMQLRVQKTNCIAFSSNGASHNLLSNYSKYLNCTITWNCISNKDLEIFILFPL